MAVNPKKLRPYDEPPRVRRSLIPSRPDSAAAAFHVLALLWLVAAAGLGALWALMLMFPDQLGFRFEVQVPIVGTIPIEASQATVFSAFVNALVFGWVSNAAFAAILFITPRLTGVRLVGEQMAWGGMALWNLGVAGGVAAIYLPTLSAAGLLAEFPLPFDGLMLLALLNVNGAFWRTLLASRERLPYVSIWFFGLALLAFMGAYGLGALAQLAAWLISFDATAIALVYAFVARLIATFWVLGATLGVLFYIVPRGTLNGLASGGMAMLSWLLWAGLSAISGLAGLADPSVPFFVTTLGNVGTMMLVAPAVLAVATLAVTLRGSWTEAFSAGTLSFALISMTFVLATAVLEAIGALRAVQGLVRGTEWMVGAMVFGTLGAATFAFFGLGEYAEPRMFRREWRGTWLTDAQQWATLAGTVMTGLALIGAGIAHGSLMADGAAGDVVNGTLVWFRIVAAGGLGLVALGGTCAIVNLFLLYTTARRAEYAPAEATASASH